MTTLPQPPPDAPAPPPSEAALRSRRWWRWIVIVGLTSLAILLLLPILLRPRHHDTPPAVWNARQIGLAMLEFENEYGAYPGVETIVAVQKKTGTTLNLGTKTSNHFFRQLIGANFTQSEEMFYAKIPGVRKPDNNMTGLEALKKGGCGFAYFLGAKSTDNTSRPLAAAPMIPGTDRFDPKHFEGYAVLLRMDNSVTTLRIAKDGHIQDGRKFLMDPTNPIWDGHPPKVV
jgi:hypothetical protein